MQIFMKPFNRSFYTANPVLAPRQKRDQFRIRTSNPHFRHAMIALRSPVSPQLRHSIPVIQASQGGISIYQSQPNSPFCSVPAPAILAKPNPIAISEGPRVQIIPGRHNQRKFSPNWNLESILVLVLRKAKNSSMKEVCSAFKFFAFENPFHFVANMT